MDRDFGIAVELCQNYQNGSVNDQLTKLEGGGSVLGGTVNQLMCDRGTEEPTILLHITV
jgi:hypothetical protein